MPGNTMRGAMAVAAALLLQACGGNVYMNEPLKAEQLAAAPPGMISGGGYRLTTLSGAGDVGTVVAATFSGGGKRSSAFSYGILKGMRDYELAVDGRRTTLLRELDLISSVSGGTFTA